MRAFASATRRRTFVWDQDNMLMSCTVAASASVGMPGTHAYAYDAIGRRVSKTVDNNDGTFETTVFSQLTLPIPPLGTPGGQVLAEYAAGEAAASPERSYAFGSYCDEPLVMATPAERYYYHRDGRYSIISLSSETAGVVERYAYNLYGEGITADAAGFSSQKSLAGNPWNFTGRTVLREASAVYFRGRLFLPQIGCFCERDLPLLRPQHSYIFPAAASAKDPSGWSRLCNDDKCDRIKTEAGEAVKKFFPEHAREMLDKGCLPEVSCEADCSERPTAQGFYDPKTGNITLCMFWLGDVSDGVGARVLTHEFIHAIDYCLNKGDQEGDPTQPGFCKDKMCRELRAWGASGQCDKGTVTRAFTDETYRNARPGSDPGEEELRNFCAYQSAQKSLGPLCRAKLTSEELGELFVNCLPDKTGSLPAWPLR